MASYNTPIITTQGQSLLKATIANNDTMTFTKIVFSSDDYSQTADSAVQALTGLSNLDLTAPAKSFTDVNGNLKIRAVGNNENTSSAFYIKTYGLYGTNKAGNELLIAVATTQNANFVPAYNGKQTNQISYTFNIAISSTNNITLSSSTDVGVTQADLAGINNYVNSNASSASLAIASNASSINSVQSSVTANSSAIASNASSISNLQSTVSSNSSAIANNSKNINNLQTSLNNVSGSMAKAGTIDETTDIRGIRKPGLYTFSGHGQNAQLPTNAWRGSLIVTCGQDNSQDIFHIFLSDNGTNTIMYFEFYNSSGQVWTNWQQVANTDMLNSAINQINANMQYLSNRTGAIEQYYFHNQRQLSNTDDLNNVRATGTYTINNIFPQNMPTAEVIGSNGSQSYLYNDYLVVVFSDGTNVQQELINSALGTHYQRSLYSTGSSNWQKLVTEDETNSIFQKRQPFAGSIDDFRNQPDGYFEVYDWSDKPDGSSGYGLIEKTTFANNMFLIYRDLPQNKSYQNSFSGTPVHWLGWQKIGGGKPLGTLLQQGFYTEDDTVKTTPQAWRVNLWKFAVQAGHTYSVAINVTNPNIQIACSYSGDINNGDAFWIGTGGPQSNFTPSKDGDITIGITGNNVAMQYSNFRIVDVTTMKSIQSMIN